MGKGKSHINLKKELRRLAEHRTYKDGERYLGKGVFSVPINDTRTKKKEHDFSKNKIRIGEEFQAVLPEYTDHLCLRERREQLLKFPNM